MIYPLNIFTPDPVTKNLRPFMIFIPFKIEFDIIKQLSYGVDWDIMTPRMPFVLPFPTNGLQDNFSNTYTTQPSVLGNIGNKLTDKINSLGNKLSLGTIDNLIQRVGIVPDPKMTNTYMGSQPRRFSGVWQFVPQNFAEALSMIAILAYVKYCASPDKKSLNKALGVLTQPYIFTIIFSNPSIQLLTSYYKMSLESYNISYFVQGYSSTYSDMMPKNVELTMNFIEYGLKTKEDWLMGGIGI